MKILHVIWDLGQGGAQTYLYQLIKELLRSRPDYCQEVFVLSSQGSLSKKFKQLGVSVRYAGMRNGIDFLAAIKVYHILYKSGADIIHSHSNNLMFNALLYLFNKPNIYTEHGGGLLSRRGGDLFIYKYMNRHITKFIAISSSMNLYMMEINPDLSERVVTIHNGVNIQDIEAIGSVSSDVFNDAVIKHSYYVGIIGRLVEQKGIDLFINVANRIIKERDDVAFVIVGDGELRERLQAIVYDMQINEKVFFTGYRRDSISWLKYFDVFLFTSKFEPFGLVITEAMASGIPVVAANRKGAVPEIIDNGITGLTVDGDDIENLAKSVCSILDNIELRNRLVSSAKTSVSRQFSIEINAKKLSSLYDNL